jgi:hypothetical protein
MASTSREEVSVSCCLATSQRSTYRIVSIRKLQTVQGAGEESLPHGRVLLQAKYDDTRLGQVVIVALFEALEQSGLQQCSRSHHDIVSSSKTPQPPPYKRR